MPQRTPIDIVLARFEDIISRGLTSLIAEDANLRLVAGDVPHERLAAALADFSPRVAILNFGSLASAVEIRDLARDFPDTRLLVLANRPTANESRQLIAFGATA